MKLNEMKGIAYLIMEQENWLKVKKGKHWKMPNGNGNFVSNQVAYVPEMIS